MKVEIRELYLQDYVEKCRSYFDSTNTKVPSYIACLNSCMHDHYFSFMLARCLVIMCYHVQGGFKCYEKL